MLGVAADGRGQRAAQRAAGAHARAGLVLSGGAAFEELVFRLGVLSLCYLAVRRGLLALGTTERAASLLAEIAALALSAVVFAASHLRFVVAGLAGAGGEPFEGAIFTWRVLALTIGAGPEVFL